MPVDRVIGNGLVQSGAGAVPPPAITRIKWYVETNGASGDGNGTYFHLTFNQDVLDPGFPNAQINGLATESCQDTETKAFPFRDMGYYYTGRNGTAAVTSLKFPDVVMPFLSGGQVQPGALYTPGDGIMDATPDATIAF